MRLQNHPQLMSQVRPKTAAHLQPQHLVRILLQINALGKLTVLQRRDL